MPHQPREELVARLAQDLEYSTAPRLQLLIMMIVAGGAAFLASVLLLWSPAETFELMAPRYAVAALCGYLVFVVLIRLWIALHRPSDVRDIEPPDVLDAIDLATDVLPSEQTEMLFAGGHSGSGGASTQWSGKPSSGRVSDSWLPGLDLDDGVWLVVAAACAAGGLIAIAYVVYMAPILLAEVALDAAIVSVLYRRLRRDEQGYWLTTVVRRTAVPALILVLFAFAAGFALQQAVPHARSIGGVVQTIGAR